MTLFITAVITGIAVGSIYGLIAIGYTVVFNATRIFNLAQGDLVMLGVLISYYLLDVLHWPELAAFAGVMLAVPLVSLLEERFVVRPFLRRSPENIGWFIATLAFSLIVETVVTFLYGDHPPLPVPSPLSGHPVHFGSVSISMQLLLAIAALLLVTVVVEWFYGRTWAGSAMRASAEDRELCALRGIEPVRMSVLAFAIGGLIGGVGGFVIAPVVFANVSIGLTYSLKGFIALAIGGFGSIRGAVVGAVLLGVSEQLFDLYVDPSYEIVVGLTLLMLILVIRPTGLFGDVEARRV